MSETDFREQLDKMDDKVKSDAVATPPDSGIWYWIWGIDKGRRLIWGPFRTDAEAYSKGYEKLTGNFEVVPLTTKNDREASKRLRAKLIDQSGLTDDTFQKFRHQI